MLNEIKVDPETGEILEEFSIDSEEKFVWAMKKLFDMRAELNSVEAQRKEINDNLDTMHNRIQTRISGFLYTMGPQIEKYARENLPENKKSIVTPYGKVQFRKVPASYKVVNDEAFMEWARSHFPEAVEYVPKVYKSKIPELVLAQAEGVEYVPEREKVEI